ncbi:MAG: hypothetical protein R3B90_06645 [Planctomycetaceae bacterium]
MQFIDVAPAPSGNLAVMKIEPSHEIATAGQSLEWTATIRNFSRSPVTTRLEWRDGNTVVDIVSVDVPPLEETTSRYRGPASGSWAHTMEARLLIEDRLSIDNQRRAVVPLRESIRVLLVDGQPALRPMQGAADYVQLALSPPRTARSGERASPRLAIQPTVLPDTELANANLRDFDVVWLCNVPTVPSQVAARLAGWVEQGGGLIITLGDAVDASQYNGALGGEGADLLPARLGARREPDSAASFVTMRPTEPFHPILSMFAGNPDAGLLTTIVESYIALDGELASGAEIAVWLSNDDPLVLTRSRGAGRTLMVLTSADDRWGNWGVWPSFVPMVHRFVRYVAVGAGHPNELEVSTPIIRRLPPMLLETEPRLTRPDGQTLSGPPAVMHRNARSGSIRPSKAGCINWNWAARSIVVNRSRSTYQPTRATHWERASRCSVNSCSAEKQCSSLISGCLDRQAGSR